MRFETKMRSNACDVMYRTRNGVFADEESGEFCGLDWWSCDGLGGVTESGSSNGQGTTFSREQRSDAWNEVPERAKGNYVPSLRIPTLR